MSLYKSQQVNVCKHLFCFYGDLQKNYNASLLTIFTPVSVPRVSTEPVGNTILLPPAKHLDGVSTHSRSGHMLIHTWRQEKGKELSGEHKSRVPCQVQVYEGVLFTSGLKHIRVKYLSVTGACVLTRLVEHKVFIDNKGSFHWAVIEHLILDLLLIWQNTVGRFTCNIVS